MLNKIFWTYDQNVRISCNNVVFSDTSENLEQVCVKPQKTSYFVLTNLAPPLSITINTHMRDNRGKLIYYKVWKEFKFFFSYKI